MFKTCLKTRQTNDFVFYDNKHTLFRKTLKSILIAFFIMFFSEGCSELSRPLIDVNSYPDNKRILLCEIWSKNHNGKVYPGCE